MQDNDPYIWLEDVQGEKALEWVEAQNEKSLARLESDPRFKTIRADAAKILTATDRIPYASYVAGEMYNFWQDGAHVRGLWRKTSLDSYKTDNPEWETVLDLDRLSADEGENWVYKGRDCLAPDYQRCLIRLSRGGGDAVVIREFDAASKSFVEDGFVLPEGKQDASWLDENTVIAITSHGGGTTNTSGYARMVRIWERGMPIEEARLVYESEQTDAFIGASVFRDGDDTHAFVQRRPDFFREQVFYIDDSGNARALALPDDVNFQGILQGDVIALTRSDWKAGGHTYPGGSMVAIDLADLIAHKAEPHMAQIFTPGDGQSVDSAGGVAITRSAVMLSVLDTVKGKLVKVEKSGGEWVATMLPLPENGSVQIADAGDDHDVVMLVAESFLRPETLYLIEGDQAPEAIKSLPARFDPAPYVSEQFFATSKDGTKIPYFLVRSKDTAFDGTTPTLLYGYGGFEISLKPDYVSPLVKTWLEQGGAYAVANIRGGGEFGPRWHQAALLENRQKAFDDFAAVAEDLIAGGLTSPEHLGIYGGSNGGLLVGATFVQRPELFNAVISAVPLLDMFRYHKLLAGASWMGEYGDPDDPAMRAVIATYSPYQNLKADGEYPEVFFTTSTKDDRVHPGHARKMAAKMIDQGHDILYFENTEGGHAAAANLLQRARLTGLQAVYLLQQLKDPQERKKASAE